ncbi:YrhB domain-containing protein [Pseudoalteromonas xiamenensis]
MNEFGCALPNYVNPNIKLVIDERYTEAHEFGWVFYFNSAQFIESEDWEHALAGNAPIIVDKSSSKLIHTGTANSTEYYVANYIKNGDPHKRD